MKKTLSLMLCAVLMLAILLPTLALAAIGPQYVYTKNQGSLNLRKTMQTGCKNVLIQIPYGAEVTNVKYVNDTWVMATYGGKTGYCMRRYLVSSKPAPKTNPKPASNTDGGISNSIFSNMKACYYEAYVRPATPTDFVYLRWAPSKSAKIHKKYYSNASLIVMAENNNWCQVLDQENNIMGFMMRSFLVPVSYGTGNN